jgi:hypothetical protein
LSFTGVDGWLFTQTFDPVSGTLILTSLNDAQPIQVAGDYNQNGRVDAADYVVWRNNLGSNTALPNDDTPGVGQDDYTRWRIRFGQSAGAGSSAIANAAVPEPAALLIFVAGVVSFVPRRNFCSPIRPSLATKLDRF